MTCVQRGDLINFLISLKQRQKRDLQPSVWATTRFWRISLLLLIQTHTHKKKSDLGQGDFITSCTRQAAADASSLMLIVSRCAASSTNTQPADELPSRRRTIFLPRSHAPSVRDTTTNESWRGGEKVNIPNTNEKQILAKPPIWGENQPNTDQRSNPVAPSQTYLCTPLPSPIPR